MNICDGKLFGRYWNTHIDYRVWDAWLIKVFGNISFLFGNIKSIFVFLHFVATVTISWCILPSYYYFALKRTNHMLSENFASLFHEFHLFPSGQRAQTSLYECSHHTTCLELVCSEWLSTENYKNKYSLWKLFNVP